MVSPTNATLPVLVLPPTLTLSPILNDAVVSAEDRLDFCLGAMGILEDVADTVVPAVAPVVDVDVSDEDDDAPDISVLRRGIPLIVLATYGP